jgi:hypothetical protein
MNLSRSIRLASFVLAGTLAAAATVPAQAAVHGWRNGKAGHVAGTIRNDQGGLTHFRGSRATGARGTVGHGAATTVNPDGSLSHRGGTRITGANGGSFTGSNNYTRNADGSAQGSFQRSGTGAAGSSYSSSGSYSRSSTGQWSASRQTQASGARGSYDGSTTASNGTVTHDSAISNAAGDTYNGQTSWTKSQGISHAGSCTDAGGNAIPCQH